MSELLKEMKNDLKLAMKREVEYRKSNIISGTIYEATIAVKDVVRAIISMFPEIGVKPDKGTDDDTIKLLKKYIASEKLRELYIQRIITASDTLKITAKELNVLQKDTITNLGHKLTSIKIGIAQSYLPKEPSMEEIKEWVDSNINLDDYRNKMQAMGPIMKEFKGVDGNKVKQMILKM